MFDRLKTALDRYQLLRESEATTRGLGSSEGLSHWITEAVCPVAEELFQRSDFRQLALWSINNLAQGADTDARRLVDAIDRQLVKCAERFLTLSSRQTETPSTTPNDVDSPTGNPTGEVANAPSPVNKANLPAIVAFVIPRPWRDLVAIQDYFGPTANLNLVDRRAFLGPDSDLCQFADFSPYLHPHWKLPGDHISRATLTRIDYWLECLKRFMVRLEQQGDMQSSQGREITAGLRIDLAKIYPLRTQLDDLCFNSDDVQIRRSAITLVQAYAAFKPTKPLPWLGPAENGRSYAPVMRYFLEKREQAEVAAITAAALNVLSSLYDQEVRPEDQIAEQVQRKDLVVIYGVGSRQVYWRRKPVNVDWYQHDRAWTLFVNIAERAKLGLGVDDFNGLRISLKDAKRDLGRLLEDSLADLITRKLDVFKLEIPADQICIFNFEQRDVLIARESSSLSCVSDERSIPMRRSANPAD